MSLRTRILLLFLGVAVVPLLALGIVEYQRSQRALESMIAAQNERVAERAAAVIRARATLLSSDVLLLGENADTQRWLTAVAAGGADSATASAARRFLESAWNRIGEGYAGLVVRSTADEELLQLERTEGSGRPGSELPEPLEATIHELQTGRPLGRLTLRPLSNGVFPEDLLASGFGEQGYGMVIDRRSGRVLYHPSDALRGKSVQMLMRQGAWDAELAELAAPKGTFRFRDSDTLRVASYVSLAEPQWTVVMTGAVAEFSEPFTDVRRWSLALFLLVALGGTVVFSQLLRRTTQSLEDLTVATAIVSRGDLAPNLPPSGPDEVGRLSASFGTMVHRVREMIHEVELSRQMAVLGEFAAQLSHEVRNPLTSIKLNLQKLQRQSRDGALPLSSSVPLDLALKEVDRLDQVVRGVLHLTRERPSSAADVSVTELVESAVATIRPQALTQGVDLLVATDTDTARVQVDRAHVAGALLNLMLNALAAMPTGGRLDVSTTIRDGEVLISVRDSGVGMDVATANDVFRPFFTTRPDGTGLGLPLARRAIEENKGALQLVYTAPGAGTEFQVIFPLLATPTEHA